MQPIYELAVIGDISQDQISSIRDSLIESVGHFGLRIHEEVAWYVNPKKFSPKQQRGSALIFFGGPNAVSMDVAELITLNIPILPVISDSAKKIETEIPAKLRHLNCLWYDALGPERIASTLLGCIGLLPTQRRVFLSYRREESRQVALQLFDDLSSKQYEVFLDTHGISPAQDFQAMLWHKLCDSDVLIMLDTPGYFDSRWTSAEFGRALAKGISILRIEWPETSPSERTHTSKAITIAISNLDESGRLSNEDLKNTCLHVERLRSQSHAVRRTNLFSNLKNSTELLGGTMLASGAYSMMHIRLGDGREFAVLPVTGIPDSTTLHDAQLNSHGLKSAVIYDHVGILKQWLGHLEWLETEIPSARWIQAATSPWTLADLKP